MHNLFSVCIWAALVSLLHSKAWEADNEEWLFGQLEVLLSAKNETHWPKGEKVYFNPRDLKSLKAARREKVSKYTPEQKYQLRYKHSGMLQWLSNHHPTRIDLREKFLHRAIDYLGLFHKMWQAPSIYHEDIGRDGLPYYPPEEVQRRWPAIASAMSILQSDLMATLGAEFLAADEKGRIKGMNEAGEGLHLFGDWNILEIGKTRDVHHFTCSSAQWPKSCKAAAAVHKVLRSEYRSAVLWARFASLHPSTKIVSHFADDNHRLKIHCGIVNPDGMEMQLANLTLVWKPGECFLFDDSYEHAIESTASQRKRTILELKIEHPDIQASGYYIHPETGKRHDLRKKGKKRKGTAKSDAASAEL